MFAHHETSELIRTASINVAAINCVEGYHWPTMLRRIERRRKYICAVKYTHIFIRK